MIRYLVVAIVLVLLVACKEPAPTRWPTSTPLPTSVATGASEAEPAGIPDTNSGEAATAVPADASGDSGAAGPGGAMAEEGSTMVESDAGVVITESGLQIKDLVVGTGEQPEQGAIVVVHYTGWLVDGTKFDSSVDRGTPFEFTLGQGQVIKGWDEGVATMRVGGKRKLTIPPELAYGDEPRGNVIKAGDTLVFEIELLELK